MEQSEVPRDNFLDRPFPSNTDAERAILGGIILDNSLVTQAVQLGLKPGDFYKPFHSRIFDAMLTLFQFEAEINPILICNQLRLQGVADYEMLTSDVANLTYGLPTLTNLAHYAKVVKEDSSKRQIIKVCNKATYDALAGETASKDLLEFLSQQTFELAFTSTSQGLTKASPIIHKVVQRAWDVQQGDSVLRGLPTDLLDLDAITLGLQPSDSIIWAGRPSSGKTALMVQVASTLAIIHHKKIAVFSLEMSEEQIAVRWVCRWAEVDSTRFNSGHCTHEEWSRIHNAVEQFEDANLFIDPTPGQTVLEMKAKLLRFVQQYKGLDAVFIDYLQLIGGEKGRGWDRQNEVSQISKQLKGLAKEFDVPFVILCQLNRGPEGRTDHRPMLADLRESGGIEQDADVAVLFYREDQYKQNADPSEKSHTAELNVAKHRNGATGVALVGFQAVTTRFTTLAHNYHANEENNMI